MIEVHNRKIIRNLPAEEYFAMPGFSFSGLKNAGAEFKKTAKMQTGTNVHDYLLTPEVYQHEDRAIVKPAAMLLKQTIGPLFERLEHEVVVTCEFHYHGFKLYYKGRIDSGIENTIVCDYKVTEANIDSVIKYFQYDDQISGYMLAFGARVGIIASIHPKGKKAPQIRNMAMKQDWWMNKIITNGEAI